jgi:arsenate reductase
VEFVQKEIRETPPSPAELAFALRRCGGERKKLFNTAGAEFRAMGLKDQLDTMDESSLFSLIQQQGNLCKRPFLIDETKGIALVGFDEGAWQTALGC